ncbi:MAG: PRC-barrel domain-containing protein [Peptococcaceae bacterium]|nr:PRC-barrel domain-containing protein [Peptococcaceae bacterium]
MRRCRRMFETDGLREYYIRVEILELLKSGDGVKRMSELIGLPVLGASQGPSLGDVCDVVFDEQEDTLLGVLTDPADPAITGGYWLARKDIESISPLGVVGKPSSCQLLGCLWSEKVGERIRWLPEPDQLRGTVSDVYVSDGFRKVMGYEIADGLFADGPGGFPVRLDTGTLREDSYDDPGKEVTL